LFFEENQVMPKINRQKLLEYLETEYAEELELSDILRSCEVQGYEERLGFRSFKEEKS
jgi:hypothetical protein